MSQLVFIRETYGCVYVATNALIFGIYSLRLDFMISYEAPQWVQTNLLAALRVFVSAAIFRTPLMCLCRSPLINGMLPPLILFH